MPKMRQKNCFKETYLTLQRKSRESSLSLLVRSSRHDRIDQAGGKTQTVQTISDRKMFGLGQDKKTIDFKQKCHAFPR